MSESVRGTRITGAERERLSRTLRENYVNGASLRELARQTGRSYGFVHSMLAEAGVTLRGRGGSRRAQMHETRLRSR